MGTALIDEPRDIVRGNHWDHASERMSSHDSHYYTEMEHDIGDQPIYFGTGPDDVKLRVSSSDPNDPRRHVGYGVPLITTSWLNRPIHADAFVGALFGDELIRNRVNQRGGVLNGLRLGIDFDHYWGGELRFATSNPRLEAGRGQAKVQFFDFHLLYYPWGDAHWRPYATLGSGLARYSFVSDTGQSIAQTMYHLPVGIGMKYFFKKSIALRMEFRDNIAFGHAGVRTLNNLSLTSGIEWHFGGRRRSYYPYDSKIRHW